MKRFILLQPLRVLAATSVRAQDGALEITLQHLRDNVSTYRLTDADLEDVAVSSSYQDASGVTHLYLLQRRAGIEVHHGILNAHVRQGEVVHVGNRFVSKLAARVNTTMPALPAVAAIEAAARNLDLPYSEAVEVKVEMAEQFLLDPVYPNPFNPQATVRFAVKMQEEVRIELYNALGQRVRVLYEGAPQAGTYQEVTIDGANLAGGLYIVRVVGESFAATQRVMLVK